MDEESKYWRSRSGADRYEREFSRHWRRMLRANRLIRSYDCGYMRIDEWSGFPDAGMTTLLSRGMSAYILDDARSRSGGSRIELAWTVKSDPGCVMLYNVIESIADSILDQRKTPPLDEVIFDVRTFKGCVDCLSRNNIFLMTDHWFERAAWRMSNHFPLELFEIVALTDDEAVVAKRNIEDFFQSAEESGFDATNVF